MSPPVSSRFPLPRHWWMLAGGLGVLFLFSLGSRGLNEPDEGRYANVALSMIKGGDWWEPRESGFGHYDKPPLIYWATAISFRAFGLNEWAARLPSVVGAGLALLGLAWATVRLHGEKTAWWAVLVCGTSVQYWVLGRILSPDFLMTGWCTLAVAAWTECRHRDGAWSFWGLSLGFWTLAWWTKATPSLVPLAGVVAGTCATGDRTGLRALRIWLLAPLILLFGSPWYLSMLRRYPELSPFFFQRELMGRMVGRVDGRHSSKFYYVPVSLAAWLPWWPWGAWSLWRRRAATPLFHDWRRRLGIEGWIVLTGLGLFSLANSKLPTYTLVLAPWAALLIARCLVPGEGERFPTRLLLPAVGSAFVALLAVALLPRRWESKMGPNSSLRPVCEYLIAHGAREIDADHYWPGMEFYLRDRSVHYVLHVSDSQQERGSDGGLKPGLFIDPMDWLGQQDRPGLADPAAGDRWLVRFRKHRDSPFDLVLSPDRREKVASIGQFDLFHIVLSEARTAPSSAPPP